MSRLNPSTANGADSAALQRSGKKSFETKVAKSPQAKQRENTKRERSSHTATIPTERRRHVGTLPSVEEDASRVATRNTSVTTKINRRE